MDQRDMDDRANPGRRRKGPPPGVGRGGQGGGNGNGRSTNRRPDSNTAPVSAQDSPAHSSWAEFLREAQADDEAELREWFGRGDDWPPALNRHGWRWRLWCKWGREQGRSPLLPAVALSPAAPVLGAPELQKVAPTADVLAFIQAEGGR